MKRAIAAAFVIVLTCSSCTFNQMNRYFEWLPIIGQEKVDEVVAQFNAEEAEDTAGRPCADAYPYFRDAGFARSQWAVMSALCWRESQDTLTAVSPTHDFCWWQINRTAHQKRLLALGIIQASMYDLLYDPQACANAAYDVWSRAGYGAWATFHG
jgi:hypothetical protein